nr:reverse transcriptase domain-containing protein [Tanacetum cinerariifolium]
MKLCSLLKENLDIFVWQPSNMTGIPRSVAEHRLNIREGYTPVRQKKRGQDPKRARAIQVETSLMIPAFTSFCTSTWMALARSGAWPLFFCRTGVYPSRILSRCSATDRGIPVMSDGCHANISKFSLRREHSFVRLFTDSVLR